mgnify:CR=1 FL=1
MSEGTGTPALFPTFRCDVRLHTLFGFSSCGERGRARAAPENVLSLSLARRSKNVDATQVAVKCQLSHYNVTRRAWGARGGVLFVVLASLLGVLVARFHGCIREISRARARAAAGGGAREGDSNRNVFRRTLTLRAYHSLARPLVASPMTPHAVPVLGTSGPSQWPPGPANFSHCAG